MPQMSPMNWLFLLIYFQFIYFILLMFIYFSYFNMNYLNKKLSKYFYVYLWY